MSHVRQCTRVVLHRDAASMVQERRLTCCVQVYRVFGGLSPQPEPDAPVLVVAAGVAAGIAADVEPVEAEVVEEVDDEDEEEEELELELVVVIDDPLTENWALVLKMPVLSEVKTLDSKTCTELQCC